MEETNFLFHSIFVTCNRDARLVAFRKSGSLGIQVSGGNKSGIFVAAVKEGSPAYNEGLRKGDQVLMVSNNSSNKGQVIVSLYEYHSDCLVSDFGQKFYLVVCLPLDWLKPVVLLGSNWMIVCCRQTEDRAKNPSCYLQSKNKDGHWISELILSEKLSHFITIIIMVDMPPDT